MLGVLYGSQNELAGIERPPESAGTGPQNVSIEPFQTACGADPRLTGRGTFEVDERKFLSMRHHDHAPRIGKSRAIYDNADGIIFIVIFG